MKPPIYLGADHGGFALKEALKSWLRGMGYTVTDCGAQTLDPEDDYPVFARAVAEQIGQNERGILLCRSGSGVAIVANKFPGIRAAVAWDETSARAARSDDKSNILCLPADHLDAPQAQQIIETWLKTEFKAAPKYQRRLDQITDIERHLKG